MPIKRLVPPPSIIKLVSDSFDGENVVDNSKADSIWKKWFSKLAELEDYINILTFSNSWVNVGSPYYDAAYYQDNYGIVRLRGRIENGTSGLAAFVLPEGYRSIATMSFGVDGASGGGSGGSHGTIEIDASGNVTPTLSGSNPKLSLDGITFRAEQ